MRMHRSCHCVSDIRHHSAIIVCRCLPMSAAMAARAHVSRAIVSVTRATRSLAAIVVCKQRLGTSSVDAFSMSSIVDAIAINCPPREQSSAALPLHRSTQLIEIVVTSCHITSLARIRHHSAIEVGRGISHNASQSVALLAGEATIGWDAQGPHPYGAAGCKARKV